MIRIGLIGFGYWGPNLARCIAETDGCSLAAVADGSPEALSRAAMRHDTARPFARWREMIEEPTIDAIAIATPVATHFEMAMAALQAGKHVLVEKPMTDNSVQASLLIEEAARRRLTLLVDHTFIYTGAVRKIREVIDRGELGDIYYYDSTRINLGLFQSDVNVIWDLAVHDMAILEFLLDARPEWIAATGAQHIRAGQENMANVTIAYSQGTMAHLNVNWLAPVKIRQTLIGGSRRMIVYDDLLSSEKIKIYDRGVSNKGSDFLEPDMRVSYRSGDMWAPQLSVKEALLTEIEHFIACIETGTQPMTSGASGLHVVQMLECAVSSLRNNGRPVELAAQEAVR